MSTITCTQAAFFPFSRPRFGCFLLFFASCLPACTEIQLGSTVPNTDDNMGSISGRVCSESGDSWLEGAYIYSNIFASDGSLLGITETWSDRDGYFILPNVPASEGTTLYVQYGTYTTTYLTEVKKGEVSSLEEPECRDPYSIQAAVVAGTYDSFSSLLENVGIYHYATVDGTDGSQLRSFLIDAGQLSGYDLLCINGGVSESGVIDDPDVIASLEAYVEGGGSLVVTDWSYDVIERVFPEHVDFSGDDTQLDAAEVGVAEVLSAQVIDQSLANYLQTQQVNLRYDLPFWPVLQSAKSAVNIHLMGDVHVYVGAEIEAYIAAPLLISFSAGYGSVVLSTFRAESNLNDDTSRILEYMLYEL